MSNTETLKQLNPYYSKNNTIATQSSNVGSKFTFTVAEFDIEKFLQIFPEFKSLFEKENNKFNFIFDMYKTIAIKLFSREEYGNLQIHCIACYVAHYLELSLARNKNMGNSVNLNTENASTTVNRDMGANKKKAFKSEFENIYGQTIYGQMVYPYMKMIGSMRIRGVY